MSARGFDVILASGFSWWWAILFIGLGLALVARAYSQPVRRAAGGRWRAAMGCRALGALALLLLILRPELDLDRQRTEKRTVLMLLDQSGSMALRDSEGGPTRLQQAALRVLDCERALAGAAGLQLRIVPFADACAPSVSGADLLGLVASGEASHLGEALRAAVGVTPPVERVIIVSDGNDTTGLDIAATAAALGVRVYTVVVGRDFRADAAYRDVWLESADHRDSVPVGSVTEVVAQVDAVGFTGRTVAVSLRAGRETLARREIVLDGIKGPQPVTLNFHPRQIGLIDLAVTVEPLGGERVGENNTVNFPLAVHEKLPRVVYVEGAIRPDYKFLRRALATDPGLEFMSLVRVREGDFIRQGSIGGMELTAVPQTRAELSAIDVLILGELAAAEIGDEVLVRIRQAVSNGLGLLVLAGPAMLGSRSRFPGTPLDAVFPAELAQKTSAKGQTFRVYLTAAGQAEPLGKGLETYFGTRDQAPTLPLPRLTGLDLIRDIKPACAVVLAARDPAAAGKELPVLVTGRYGKGKAALFLGRGAWQWSLMRRGTGRTGPYARFWGQLVRWCAGKVDAGAETGPAFSVTADRLVVQAGEEIVISAAVREFAGVENPQVVASVSRGGKQVDKLAFAALPAMTGVFESRFSSTQPGAYKLRVRVVAAGKEIAAQSLTVRVRGGRSEFERLSPDRKLLQRIAHESDGKVIGLDELPEFFSRLATKARTRRQILHVQLWHETGLYWGVVVFFALEWLLRKRAGLP